MAAEVWPAGFFDRADAGDDGDFYRAPRLVTHIDQPAIAAVTDLYVELGVPDGRVLDLMSSWVSHLPGRPAGGLVALGLNAAELRANPLAERAVVQDLNRDPELPFDDASFDTVTCCVSVDYLVRPVEVLAEVARVLAPQGLVVLTFSNRCFPTKAIQGWLQTDDEQHLEIVRAYLRQTGGFGDATTELRTPRRWRGDPLYGVWARSRIDPGTGTCVTTTPNEPSEGPDVDDPEAAEQPTDDPDGLPEPDPQSMGTGS